MEEDFNKFTRKIVSLIRRQNLNADITEMFFQYTNQIIEQRLNDQISDYTDIFLDTTVPKVGSMLLSSLAMNTTQLQFSITLLNCLNTLALWGMLNDNESLVNSLLDIANSNASYYVKNSIQQPNLFIEKVHYFFTSPFWDQLNDKMATPDNFQVPMLFTIYAFIFQYCSSCKPSDEIVCKIISKYPKIFCDFVNSIDDETLSECLPSKLIIIIESLNKIYSGFGFNDTLPAFMQFLSRSAKSENFEKQYSALSILNSYALSENGQIAENFDKWKKETDVVSFIIEMDLPLEILKASKDLIGKVIHDDDELAEFLIKVKSRFIAKRQFSFHLIAQIIVERREFDLISKLTREPIDIEFLCILLIEIFKSKKEELLNQCEGIVDLIFEIGRNDLAEITPRMVLFYNELNEIDQNRNDINITSWRVKILARYIKMLSANDFVDRICIFLVDQFEELCQNSLLQHSTDPFEDIQVILEDTLTKAKQHYISTKSVSEALIRLFYIIVLFKNIKYIEGEPNHIHVKEPTNYEYFDFALDALIHCDDPSVADVAIELFSQLFSQTDFFSESITILYNFCIHHLLNGNDQITLYRILKLIYNVLVDLESDYELIDFENIRRNHKNDTKGKIMLKYKNGEDYFEIYAKPYSTVRLLINRIAMRLFRSADMIKVIDSNQNDIDPANLVHTLNQPLNVICLQNDKEVKYSSASFTLWNQGFTTTLLEILDNSSLPELTYITKRLLSFLPCDQNIMNASVDNYLQMINNANNDERFKYLLHFIIHFRLDTIKEIGKKIEVIWTKIKSKMDCFSAVFEFFFYILDDYNLSEYAMFLGGRVFRSFFLHDKKSYIKGTELYIKWLTKYINLNDKNLLKKIINNCYDEEWPYLNEIINTFYINDVVFEACVEEFLNSKLKHKCIIKLLVKLINEDDKSLFSLKISDDIFGTINQLDNCDVDEFTDVTQLIFEVNSLKSLEFLHNHQEELDKFIILGFKKGSLDANKLILELYTNLFRFEKPPTSTYNKIKQLFDQKFDVWNYKSTDHLQNKLGIGLISLDSSSYMNSLFQVFNRFPEFLNEIFLSSDPELQNFQWVLASLQKSNRDCIDPSKLIIEWNEWKGQIIDSKVEQDVAEFYHYVIQSCPESAKNLFMGKQTIQYTGEKGFEKEESEQFFSFSVKINGFTNLVQSICSMVEPEIVNKFDDEKINKTIVTKSLKITQCPQILVIQLNRFEFDQKKQMKVKNNQRFEFPEHLNIAPLLQDQKNTFYSLHSIICHSEDTNKGYYTLLHEDKKYRKAVDILKANDEKWICIQNETITELPNGYKDKAFEEGYLLFYVLDDFLTQNGGVLPEIEMREDLYNTILQENEAFGTLQTLFSVEVAKFLGNSSFKDLILYYFYNIFMHGSSEFKDYINIIKYIDFDVAIDYTVQNFINFIEIFEHQVPEVLFDQFLIFSCNLMKERKSLQILDKIIDVLSLDKIDDHAIPPLLILVYSHLKENGPPYYPISIIVKLVTFIITCIKQELSPNIKIDYALLSLAELLNWGKNNNIDVLRNSGVFKQIEENYQFIPDHLSSIESLNYLVEQATKYNLMNVKNLI